MYSSNKQKMISLLSEFNIYLQNDASYIDSPFQERVLQTLEKVNQDKFEIDTIGNDFSISGVHISPKLFNSGELGFIISSKKDRLNDVLIDIDLLVSDIINNDTDNTKHVPLAELHAHYKKLKDIRDYLLRTTDDYLFEDEDNNFLISKSENAKMFNEICVKALKLNETIN